MDTDIPKTIISKPQTAEVKMLTDKEACKMNPPMCIVANLRLDSVSFSGVASGASINMIPIIDLEETLKL